MNPNYSSGSRRWHSIQKLFRERFDFTKFTRRRVYGTFALSAVATICLNTAHCQQQIYFDGLQTTALGNATMDIDSSGHLIVSGIGTNNTDGISILTGSDSGDSAGTVSDLDVFNPDALPVGAGLSWSALDPTNLTLETLTLRRTAAGGAMFADFTGLGATTASIALFSNNTLVAYASGIAPTNPLVTFTSADTPGGTGLPVVVQPCILHPEVCYGLLDLNVSQTGPLGTVGSSLTIPGQGAVYCTRVEVTPMLPSPYSASKYHVQTTHITGQDVFGKLKNDSNGLANGGFGGGYTYGANWHSVATRRSIGVTNLGVTGLDGIDLGLFDANTCSADLVALNPQPLPPGGPDFLLSVGATGRPINSSSDRLLGNWSLVPQGTGWALSADLSPAGSPNVNVELWQGCNLLSSFTSANGAQVVSFNDSPGSSSVGYDPGDDPCGAAPPPPPWWWWVKWAVPEQVMGPGGSVFTVDRVRIGPSASTPALAGLTQVSYRMVGPQMLVLENPAVQRLGLNFNGNQHFPIGQSTVSASSGDQLSIGNIAAGGTGGVEISVGRANYGEFAFPSLPSLPSSGSVSWEFHATLDGIEDRIASTLILAGNAAGETQLTGDMSLLGATHYTVLALNGGVRVAGVSNQLAAMFSVSNFVAALPSLRSDLLYSKSYVRVRFPTPAGNPLPVIRLSPTLSVNGDEAVIMAEDAVRTMGPQNRILVTGTGVDSFQLNGEELGYFGYGHSALGSAMLTADGGMVTVGHIGSSGNNGASIDLNNSVNAAFSFAPLGASAVEGPGSPSPWIQAHVFGQFGSQQNHDLGTLQFTALAAGGFQITPDFSAVGASSHTLEVWQNGQLVQRLTGHTGNVGTVNLWPTGLGERTSGGPTGSPGCTALFGQPVQIVAEGGPTLQGDELRVYPESPAQPVGKLQTFNLLARAFDSFTITGESITPGLNPSITGASLIPASGVVLTVPTLFGYEYTIDTVNAVGPQPLPWSPANSFFGDGAVHNITFPVNQAQQFYRLRAQAPGM
jgi:hypothetical protein